MNKSPIVSCSASSVDSPLTVLHADGTKTDLCITTRMLHESNNLRRLWRTLITFDEGPHPLSRPEVSLIKAHLINRLRRATGMPKEFADAFDTVSHEIDKHAIRMVKWGVACVMIVDAKAGTVAIKTLPPHGLENQNQDED